MSVPKAQGAFLLGDRRTARPVKPWKMTLVLLSITKLLIVDSVPAGALYGLACNERAVRDRKDAVRLIASAALAAFLYYVPASSIYVVAAVAKL